MRLPRYSTVACFVIAIGCGKPSAVEEPSKPVSAPTRRAEPANKKAVPADPVASPEPKKTARRRPTARLDLRAIGTGAVIDRTGIPAGALFESKIIANNRLQWVERGAIEKVLAEQSLGALFSPEGGAQRVALGKTLKAGLLILLRRSAGKADAKEGIELVVCESQRGLRLAKHTVAVSKSPEANVLELETLVEAALAKLAEDISDVCAVPTFVNQDLSYQYAYLGGGYARLLEQHLLKRKGVLTVELAEARSLTNEAALGGGATERQLPLYFLGEYRNTGQGDSRRVEIQLKIERGDKRIAEKKLGGVAPSEAAQAILGLADQLAENVVAGKDAGETDPDAEIDQLVARAKMFGSLENWSECLSLLEAATLLDPTRRDVRWAACDAASHHVMGRFAQNPDKHSLEMLQTYRRAIEHIEEAFRPIPKSSPAKLRLPVERDPPQWMRYASMRCRDMKGIANGPSDQMIAELLQFERDVLVRLSRWFALTETGPAVSLFEWAIREQPPSVAIPIARSLILEFKDLPRPKERIPGILLTAYGPIGSRRVIADDAALMAELKSNPNPALQSAVIIFEQSRKHNAEWYESFAKAKAAENAKIAAGPHQSPLRPVSFKLAGNSDSTTTIPAADFVGATPLQQGVDLVAFRDTVYVMREKKVLKPIYRHRSKNSLIDALCFDGRYAWVSCAGVKQQGGEPSLLVIDPIDEIVHKIDSNDGLVIIPPDTIKDGFGLQRIALAPIAPGRVLLVGSFGRTWIGAATFDGPAKKKVEVFHEAREAATQPDNVLWKRNTIAFNPTRLHVLRDRPEKCRIAVGRGCGNYEVESHPLMIDPDQRTVDVFPEAIYDDCFAGGKVIDGSLYFVKYNEQLREMRLAKLDHSGKISDCGIGNVKGSFLVILGDDLFVAGEVQWFRGSLSRKTLAPVSPIGIARVGGVREFGASHHYGFLANYNTLDMLGYEIHQVTGAASTP